MKRVVFQLMIFIFVAIFTGCAVNGKVSVPNKEVATSRYDLRAAIVIKNVDKDRSLFWKTGYADPVSYHIYPDIMLVFKTSLKNVFSKIEVVDEHQIQYSDYDVILYPDFNGSKKGFGLSITWRGVGSNGKEIFEFNLDESTPCNPSMGFIPGFIPLVYIPVYPLYASIEASWMDKCFDTVLTRVIDGTIHNMKNNTALNLYAQNFGITPSENISVSVNIPINQKLPPLRKDTHAIIIGIDYKGREDVPGLKFPSQDAKKVYDVLTDARYGGVPKENATLLLNDKATTNGIKAALRKIKNTNGYVYVYYSGHGAPKAQEDKLVDAFIVPYDADISSPEAIDDTAIKISEIEKLMNESQANGIMVALDACFTGNGKSVVPAGGKPIILDTKNLRGPRGSGKVIITSSAANQQSWEDDRELKSGIFSYYLIEGLRGKAATKDEWVKVADLSKYVKENVSAASRRLKGEEQTPQVLGEGNFAVARNWDRAKVMDAEIAKSKLKAALEKGSITSEQLKKALDELKTQNRSKTLETFLEGKLDEKEFGEMY